ncbi:MAG: DUF192 domain-containing protein [Spirochaetaceae bacterium]|jgi:uncharacterized membrane protein (UPF0127 family)|nr:DUF192 domain-containing protein [Spirochaetaceae bacterium]
MSVSGGRLAAPAVRWAVFFLVIFTASCGEKKLPVKTLTLKTGAGAEVTVEAEIAAKPKEREWGFMERTDIPDGTGMLFVFDRDQVLNFWMKNTPTPLSIAYIDSRGVIRDIFDMTPYSLRNITSSRSVRYALEVPQGWFARAGISPGDTLLLNFR